MIDRSRVPNQRQLVGGRRESEVAHSAAGTMANFVDVQVVDGTNHLLHDLG